MLLVTTTIMIYKRIKITAKIFQNLLQPTDPTYLRIFQLHCLFVFNKSRKHFPVKTMAYYQSRSVAVYIGKQHLLLGNTDTAPCFTPDVNHNNYQKKLLEPSPVITHVENVDPFLSNKLHTFSLFCSAMLSQYVPST